MAPVKLLPLTLPKPLYDDLVQAARKDERSPYQQAVWILRQYLRPPVSGPDVARLAEPAAPRAETSAPAEPGGANH